MFTTFHCDCGLLVANHCILFYSLFAQSQLFQNCGWKSWLVLSLCTQQVEILEQDVVFLAIILSQLVTKKSLSEEGTKPLVLYSLHQERVSPGIRMSNCGWSVCVSRLVQRNLTEIKNRRRKKPLWLMAVKTAGKPLHEDCVQCQNCAHMG